jgi:hypothetical protein
MRYARLPTGKEGNPYHHELAMWLVKKIYKAGDTVIQGGPLGDTADSPGQLKGKDLAGMKLPPPSKKTIDLEGRLIKDGVRKAITDRQNALFPKPRT